MIMIMIIYCMSALPGAAALLFNTHTYARGRTAKGAYSQQPQTYDDHTAREHAHTSSSSPAQLRRAGAASGGARVERAARRAGHEPRRPRRRARGARVLRRAAGVVLLRGELRCTRAVVTTTTGRDACAPSAHAKRRAQAVSTRSSRYPK